MRLNLTTCCYGVITQVHASCKLIHVQGCTTHPQVLWIDITDGKIPFLMLLHARREANYLRNRLQEFPMGMQNNTRDPETLNPTTRNLTLTANVRKH